MVLCSCGQYTDDGTILCPRCEALHVLGLGMEALEDEIRSAYRLQSKAWQPENFADDPKLMDSAEAKLRDIQTAFDYLMLTSTDRAKAQRPVYQAAKLAIGATVPEPVSDLRTAFGVSQPPPPAYDSTPELGSTPKEDPPQVVPQRAQTPVDLWQRFKIPIIVLAGIVVLASLFLVWTASSASNSSEDQSSRLNGAGGRRKPSNPLVALLAQVLNIIDPQPSTQTLQSSTVAQPVPEQETPNSTPEAGAPGEPAGSSAARTLRTEKSRDAPHETQPVKAHGSQPVGFEIKPYITVGSTRAEVIALEGTPTASSDDKLVYGKSELILKDGVVVSWRIDRATSPLRVKLWPRNYVDPDLDFFSVGSTKDDVLKVQGTPTSFTEDQFEYNGAIVYFSNNRVVRWKSDPASVTLWAR